jgi:ubiquinone/menaquinone biosynthesis C-methylase UbiE
MYNEFARFYVKGDWPRYSAQMARILPIVLEHFGLWPRTILDLACGEGTFAVAMAKRGLKVTGVDQSPEMLEIARGRAANDGVKIRLIQQDMRSLSLRGRFDLVTCWFDSLNYLLEIDDLARTFARVSRVLDKNGVFIFDMNTIRGLAVEWVREPSYVHLDSGHSFLVSVPEYDDAARIASLHITGFSREGDRWVRMDEVHRERGYTLREIRGCLKKAHLREMACWASLDRMDRPGRGTARVWFVVRRQPV